MKAWFLAIRPQTLAAGICPVLIGTVLTLANHQFVFFPVAAALLGAIFIQIGTNLTNDYFDFKKGADTPERVGPTRVTQSELIKPKTVLGGVFIAFGLAVLCGLYLVYKAGFPVVVIGVLSLLSGFFYTAGPRPLAYLGLGDIFAFVFFGPVAVAGTVYVQTLHLSTTAVVAGIAPGLFSVALLTVNNLRDHDQDLKAHKKTLIVRFGQFFGKTEYTLAILGASLIPPILILASGAHHRALIASFGVLIASIPVFGIILHETGPRLNEALGSTSKLLLLYTLLFCAGWL